jgi:hypothetical protein
MEDVWRGGDIASPFLTAALNGGEWSTSRLGLFSPKERAPQYVLNRGLGGLQTDLKYLAEMITARVSVEIFHKNADESTSPALSINLR